MGGNDGALASVFIAIMRRVAPQEEVARRFFLTVRNKVTHQTPDAFGVADPGGKNVVDVVYGHGGDRDSPFFICLDKRTHDGQEAVRGDDDVINARERIPSRPNCVNMHGSRPQAFPDGLSKIGIDLDQAVLKYQ